MDDEAVDRIFAGKLYSLPNVSSKIVRIFTSSTFTDTSNERNTLMEEVYPKLKEFCREKHGLEFQVVDMRWGVRDEATDDHMTTELCMNEIKNCQRLSVGPNFVVFLGQKYGYRPIPTFILASELDMMREALMATNTEVVLLEKWYKKDSNAVPPICILQPISSILVNFNNKRVPKLQAQDQATWWETLCKMQKLLRKAAQILFNENRMDKKCTHNYFMSVTEREVINGVLNVKNTKNHTLAYIRYINNINLSNVKSASKFIDMISRSVDTEAVDLLADLRDNRLTAKIEASNLIKYTVEWIGKEGIDVETHKEYIQQFITHFYKSITRLVDRAMRKEDSSPQGQIVTELLQHLHACNNSVSVFHGRDEELATLHEYITGPSDKPFLLYGTGGCGKTSVVAKTASMICEWFPAPAKAVLIIRFVGTTPDSSILLPLLTSLSKQIAYNFLLPLEGIPEDLVPLTVHLKNLLAHATTEQPLMIFLDSVDQISGVEDSNKLSWIPLTLPPNVKLLLSCNDYGDPNVNKDLMTLQKMIDSPEQYLQLTPLGEELAMEVIRRWMVSSHRNLNNYQWRLVQNAINKCTLPIFVKLVFADICRWKSYSRPQETQLASNVTDSIMKLFDRIELQHGKLLVFHALAYITASKSGLSESELEDLISLDDKVLDDVYQYHLPPVRRIPPLLWTRIRNDLPNYLSEREADGVSVMNWYHRQFKEAATERYFKNMNMAIYFHSMIADYFSGIWGGGNPKPFRYTEVQRHRFGLTDKEGVADRKVPPQPLVFTGKDGKVARYNLRKFGELPFHLVRSRRFNDLFNDVLFNYEWLLAKLSSCPLQAVLQDFEDAYSHCDDAEAKREIILISDAMRLGGAVINEHPHMLAPQLIGRLLPEKENNRHIKQLLDQCDQLGPNHCALIPIYHSMHTPGGPMKYSLEGHSFAVFSFIITNDKRYIVSVSNRLVMWDLSTSDISRNINPEVEGIMQSVTVSPQNRRAVSYTNNNQLILFNILTGEVSLIDSTDDDVEDAIVGVHMNETHFVVWRKRNWSVWDISGKQISRHQSDDNASIVSINFKSVDNYEIIYGVNVEDEYNLVSTMDTKALKPLHFINAYAANENFDRFYACSNDNNAQVSLKEYRKVDFGWEFEKIIDSKCSGCVLQLKLWRNLLLGTLMASFKIWSAEGETLNEFLLPHGVRNISTKPFQSNTIAVSRGHSYVIAGVRKILYVWDFKTGQMVKNLDAHFARIIQLLPLVNDMWNSVITSSIDRTVKVWNIDNIFEKVHIIDRHEMPIDQVTLSSRTNQVVTVTRSCIGVWNLRTGKLTTKLADSPLGAIITHACITRNGRFVVCIECENLMVWDLNSGNNLVHKSELKSVKQLQLFDEDTKILAVSRDMDGKCRCLVCNMDELGNVTVLYLLEYISKTFRPIVLTADGLQLVILSFEKSKDCVLVHQVSNGILLHKINPRYPNMKEITQIVAVTFKMSQVALIDPDKANVIDAKNKKFIRSVPRWNGKSTRDGRYGLYAPNRGGLELIELRYGNTVKTFIPRVAEGVFSVNVTFTTNDDYVLYYHGGRQTLRVFRVSDAAMIANYRVTAEPSGIHCADDGLSVVLGTVDGCVTGLMIVDPLRDETKKLLASLPSRTGKIGKNPEEPIIRFKTAAHLATLVNKRPSETDKSSSVCSVQ